MGDSPETGSTHVRWTVLFLLCLMYLIAYLDRVSLANTAPLISQEFGFSRVTMGVIFSAFVWAYALFQVPGGWMGDRFGPRKVLTSIMTYRTVIAALTTIAAGVSSFWAVRFMLGVGEAGAFPTATRGMQLWFPREERGFVQGISHAASRFGAAIGPPLAVVIMIRYGWRMVFYVIGVISLVWSIVFVLTYRNAPEEHGGVSRSELARIRGVDHNQEIRRATMRKRPQVPWRVLLSHPNMWALMCGYFTYLYCLWIFLSWLPSYLVSYRGFTLLKMGTYAALPLGAGVVGDAVGGWLTDFLLVNGNDHRAVVGGAHGHRRGILGHCLRNDEHGGTNRRSAVTHGVWDPGGPRIVGCAIRRCGLSAIHRGRHLGVLDRSGGFRN